MSIEDVPCPDSQNPPVPGDKNGNAPASPATPVGRPPAAAAPVPTADAAVVQEGTGREGRQAPRGGIVVVMLPVSKIVPNGYNPNRMTDKELARYAAAVRHLDGLPKPLIVRP